MIGAPTHAAKSVDRLQTFSTVALPQTHWETRTCVDARCERYANGWLVRIDETDRRGQLCAQYIRRVTSRKGWTETRSEEGLTVFTFPPLTPCFKDHRDQRAQHLFQVGPHRRQVRPHRHLVAVGPAHGVSEQIRRTGRPSQLIREHTRPQDWLENLAESWNRQADLINGN